MKSFKVVQETLQQTRVLIVVDDQFSTDAMQTISDGFKKRLGANVDVVIDRVDEIPPEKSGKFRYIVSHVDPSKVQI